MDNEYNPNGGNPIPDYQQPNPYYYQQPPVAPVSNTKAIISMICGILGVTCCCGSFVPAIVAIVLALLDRKDRGGQFSGMAIAGLVCGIIGILFGVAYLVIYFIFLAAGTEAGLWDYLLNETIYY